MTKIAFDQMPNLTETFDQVKRSSEIWSSDQTPRNWDNYWIKIKENLIILKNKTESD